MKSVCHGMRYFILSGGAPRSAAMYCTGFVLLVLSLCSAAAHGQPVGLAFNGAEDYVEVPEPAACIPGASSFTIECWVKTAAGASGWNLPVEWPGNDRLYIGHNIGAGWNFVVAGNGVRTDTNADAWLADVKDTWLFIQAVVDRTLAAQTLRIYDSDADAWHEATVTPAPGETRPSGPLYIPSHPKLHPHEGALREVRFWHIARTRADAVKDMHRGLAGNEAGLVGYWPFVADESGAVRDLTANGNHAVVTGAHPVSLVFAKDLEDKPAALGKSVTLGPVELWDPDRAVTYTWLFNGVPIPDAADTSENAHVIAPVLETHAGEYQVIVHDVETGAAYHSAAVSVYIASEDWPMWRYDAARSSRTPVVLDKALRLAWVRELPRPRRAWPHQWDHRGKLDFDISYSPVVMGDSIFVPSNVTDSVAAYSINDGAERWRFYADGPVRLAPVAWEDNVYFIADDSCLYCVNGSDGRLVWKFRGGPSDHRLLGNERIISFWAARGGPVIKDGVLYFAAGIWPMHGIFIYALDARSGDVVWVNDVIGAAYVQLPHGGATGFGGIAPQGYIAATEDRLVVAGGRTPPAYLNRYTGEVEEMALRAKPEGDYAVHGGGMGHQRNELIAQRVRELAGQLDGPVFNKLAAHDRLFVTTEKGTLYCFAPDADIPVRHAWEPGHAMPRSAEWAHTAHTLMETLGETEGYALLLGAGSGDLLRELLVRGTLHIVVVEADPEAVRALRDEMAAAGLYGRRVAVIETDPASFAVQPYLFSVIASENAADAGIAADSDALGHILDRLRPYGGVAWLGVCAEDAQAVARAAQAANVDQVQVAPRDDHLFARRGGPLTGAGQWTHQYADASNTNFSPDALAKAPLGILWFGGPGNEHILPRHGHGPLPQVVGGRIILPGNDALSARCVYTGRELWVRAFPGLGHPFTDLELEKRYERGESVFMHSTNGIGANQIGSPFVTLPDAVYVRYNTQVYRLAPESGEIVAAFQLPVPEELAGKPDWGHLSICDDVIITTVTPQVFEKETYTLAFQSLADIRSRSWDGTSSGQLVALDRHSGALLWSRQADTGIRHNAVASGGGRVYLIDGLSSEVVAQLQRRGEAPRDAVMMALDLRTGAEIWTRDTDIFGTWLSYSAAHDLLLQGGRPGGLRVLDDEPGDRLAVFQAANGTPLWEQAVPAYWGPLAIRHDQIYLAPAGSSGLGCALELLTGERTLRKQSVAGDTAEWTYNRRYGCNSHNVSEHLITFRSGSAAYFDLEHDSGTGFFGGFRSGCTNNLVVADGVVNAPDYTRSCTCSYQHQTSLALIHMPDMSSIEAWTTYDGAPPDPKGHGLNFGAPGRRIDPDSGSVWHAQAGNLYRHASAIKERNDTLDWVAASAWELDNGDDNTIEIKGLLDVPYKVSFHFAELRKDVAPSERVFDVLVNGETILTDFDIVARTGGCFRAVVEACSIKCDGTMRIELRKKNGSTRDPLINGIELIVTDARMAAAESR